MIYYFSIFWISFTASARIIDNVEGKIMSDHRRVGIVPPPGKSGIGIGVVAICRTYLCFRVIK